MVDGVSEFLPALGSPAHYAAFERDSVTPPEPGDEAVLPDGRIRPYQECASATRVPAIVLNSEEFASPEALKPDNYTQAQIHDANGMRPPRSAP